MATGLGWTNEATHTLVSIWGQSIVQSKLDSEISPSNVPDEGDGLAQVRISCKPKSDTEE